MSPATAAVAAAAEATAAPVADTKMQDPQDPQEPASSRLPHNFITVGVVTSFCKKNELHCQRKLLEDLDEEVNRILTDEKDIYALKFTNLPERHFMKFHQTTIRKHFPDYSGAAVKTAIANLEVLVSEALIYGAQRFPEKRKQFSSDYVIPNIRFFFLCLSAADLGLEHKNIMKTKKTRTTEQPEEQPAEEPKEELPSGPVKTAAKPAKPSKPKAAKPKAAKPAAKPTAKPTAKPKAAKAKATKKVLKVQGAMCANPVNERGEEVLVLTREERERYKSDLVPPPAKKAYRASANRSSAAVCG